MFSIYFILSVIFGLQAVDANHLHHIIDGSYATNCEFPWLVALQIKTAKGYFLCGGSIIDKTHILTAAHCVTGAEEITVSAGSSNRQQMTTFMTVSKENIHAHHGYTGPSKFQNDITVLTLPHPIEYNSCIQPIPMAQPGDELHKTCVIAGWGETRPGKPTPVNLETAVVKLFDTRECKRHFRQVTKQQFCAGEGIAGGAEACHGDSGGPLMCPRKSDGKLVVAGTTSFGASKCENGLAVYEKVAYFINWIHSHE